MAISNSYVSLPEGMLYGYVGFCLDSWMGKLTWARLGTSQVRNGHVMDATSDMGWPMSGWSTSKWGPRDDKPSKAGAFP